MTDWRGTIRAGTPGVLLSSYRRLRRALKTILRTCFPVRICRVRGVTIKIGVSSDVEQYRVRTYAVKEPETLDWLEEYLRDDDVFMDVGANIGLYSLYAAKLNPRCKIYSFEPESQNFARLCRNIAMNGALNITPCNCPLSNREAFDLFFVGSIEAGASLHSWGRASELHGIQEALLRQGAVSVTLDNLVERYRVSPPTLLKIDVDGTEGDILDGAKRVLQSGTLRTLLVEWNFKDERDEAALEQQMAQAGYLLRRTSDWVWEGNGLRSRNFIFVRA